MSAIFEWVEPVSQLGAFAWQKQWYFFEGWAKSSGSWVRLYQYGPVALTANELAQEQKNLFANVKPGGSYDYAGVHRWEEAVGYVGWHWGPVTYRTPPGVQLEAAQAPRGPIPDPPQEGAGSGPNLGPLLQQLRTNIGSGWDATVRAYNDGSATLQRIGQGFSADETQQVLDAKLLARVVGGFLDEALSGKRTVGYDASGKTVIEALAGDEYKIEERNGQPVVVSAGQVVRGSGTVGVLPVAVTVATIVVVGAVALGAVYLCVTAIEAVKTQIHANTALKALEATGCGKPGQRVCTPEEVAAMITAINKSQTELEKSSNSNFLQNAQEAAGGILKTVLIVGAVGAAIYVGVQVLPTLLKARAAA